MREEREREREKEEVMREERERERGSDERGERKILYIILLTTYSVMFITCKRSSYMHYQKSKRHEY